LNNVLSERACADNSVPLSPDQEDQPGQGIVGAVHLSAWPSSAASKPAYGSTRCFHPAWRLRFAARSIQATGVDWRRSTWRCGGPWNDAQRGAEPRRASATSHERLSASCSGWPLRQAFGWSCLAPMAAANPLWARASSKPWDADPRRDRYGAPMWMARLVGRLIPQPGMYLVLDAPAEILQQRKQEVSFVASKHQRLAYLRLASSIPNAVVIDASEPPEQRGCEGRHERTRIRERAQQL